MKNMCEDYSLSQAPKDILASLRSIRNVTDELAKRNPKVSNHIRLAEKELYEAHSLMCCHDCGNYLPPYASHSGEMCKCH